MQDVNQTPDGSDRITEIESPVIEASVCMLPRILEIWNIPLQFGDKINYITNETLINYYADCSKIYDACKEVRYSLKNLKLELEDDTSLSEFINNAIKTLTTQEVMLSAVKETWFESVRLLYTNSCDNDLEQIYKSDWLEINEYLYSQFMYRISDRIFTAQIAVSQMMNSIKQADHQISEIFNKLKDENENITNLEGIVAEIQKSINSGEFDKSMANLKRSHRLLTEANAAIQNVMSTSMTVLGIFVTIIVTLFGSLELMNSIGEIEILNISKFAFYLLFIFTATLNLLCILLHALSRISGKSIAVFCNVFNVDGDKLNQWNEIFSGTSDFQNNHQINFQCRYCKKCSECSTFNKVRNKYPFVFYPNVVLTFLLMVTFIIA